MPTRFIHIRRISGCFALATCLVLALAGCGGDSHGSQAGRSPQGFAGRGGRPGGPGGGPPEMEAILVEAEAVQLGTIASTYTSTGTLRAEREAMVKARTRGRVLQLLVEEGDRVEPGTLLGRLEEAELKIARDRAKATAANNRIKYERAQELRDKQLISTEEYYEAEHNWKVAQSDAERAQLELSYATLKSPIPGRIAERHVSEGQEVAVGDTLFRIVDEEPLEMDLHVPEQLIGRLAAGQPADLTLDASGAELKGQISRISPVVDTETGTVKVTVELTPDGAVRTGSFARARVVTDRHENTRIVPREALVSESGEWFVYVVEEGRARKTPVKLGFEEADRVELLEGPEAGLRVVTTGASALRDQVPVEILGEEPPAERPGRGSPPHAAG